MTKEDAISILYGMRSDNLNFDDAYTKDKYMALDMAINALEHSTESEVLKHGKYNKCTRTDCLHHKGSFGCHLLSQLYEDQNKCKFYCDSNKYYFTHTDYKGVKCTYISEIKGDQKQ